MAERFGTPAAEYARRIGPSPGRVQNLVRYLESLPQEVVHAWRGGERQLTDRVLQKLPSMPRESSEYWEGWKARLATTQKASLRDRARPRRSAAAVPGLFDPRRAPGD